MGMTIAHKIIASHLVGGEMTPGSEIALKIDQTLTQDATGTMAYLQFEAMGIDRVKTELSVAYIDHNTLQNGFENADDHRYIQTVAKKHGHALLAPGQRHLPSGAFGALRNPRENAHRVGQPYADRRRHRHAGLRRRRSGRGRGDGRRRVLHRQCRAFSASTSPAASRRGSRPRTLFWNCCAASRSRAASGRSSNTAGKAWRRSPSPSARPSRIWAPSWAPPPPFSRRTRSRARL